MILVDTSIWVDHLNRSDGVMEKLLEEAAVLMHPFVLGEIALGSLRRGERVLAELGRLPLIMRAEDDEVIELVAHRKLGGLGIGFIDAHLLASCLLTPGSFLWTKDRRLASIADNLGVDATSA